MHDARLQVEQLLLQLLDRRQVRAERCAVRLVPRRLRSSTQRRLVSLPGNALMKCWRGMPPLSHARGPGSRARSGARRRPARARCRTASRRACAVKRISSARRRSARAPCRYGLRRVAFLLERLQHLARSSLRMRVEAAPAPRPSARSRSRSASAPSRRRSSSSSSLFLVVVVVVFLGDVARRPRSDRRSRRRPRRSASRPSRSCRRARGSRRSSSGRREIARIMCLQAVLDALGDLDLAFARQQLDRAHLAHVHAHRVGGAAELGVDASTARLRPLPRRLRRWRRSAPLSDISSVSASGACVVDLRCPCR